MITWVDTGASDRKVDDALVLASCLLQAALKRREVALHSNNYHHIEYRVLPSYKVQTVTSNSILGSSLRKLGNIC